jgi:large subunit ribosomal protein L13
LHKKSRSDLDFCRKTPTFAALFESDNRKTMKIDTLSFRTYSAKPGEVEQKWFVANAEGQTLGRFASQIAKILRGKHKPQFTPHVDTGDYVIVVNASKIRVTGGKFQKKTYYHNTQYPGGARFEKYRDVLAKKPERVIEQAVWGMLPKNSLGRKLFRKLKVYANADHPHAAQHPVELKLN